jgi:uncharacterized protein (TIGR01777 family)
MKPQTFSKRTCIAAPAHEVFAWHARPGALERLTPPWESVKLVERTGGIEDGARVRLETRLGPLPVSWVVEHRDYQAGVQFRDVQLAGPFARWEHLHRVEATGPEACYLEDRIEYVLPLGRLGQRFAGGMIQRKLRRLFDYRHRTTVDDIAAHRPHRGGVPMKILVTGASGFVGSALVPFLTTGGHKVTRLVRPPMPSGASTVQWDPAEGRLDPSDLEGYDAVIHLAGESIASRWTSQKKAQIRDGRVKGTYLLCNTLARLEKPPKVLVCASAIGYYGDRGGEILTEESPPGSSFLARVCQAWEAAAQPAVNQGIRVAHLRFGMILSPTGGALAKLLPAVRLGLGGTLGQGRQYVSWIALDDAIGAIYHALSADELSGPVNVVAPQAVTNRELTGTLGQVLRRPTPLPMPAFAARLLLGEMADELLLASARVAPRALQASRYVFRFPKLDEALHHLLGPEPEQRRNPMDVSDSTPHV